MDITNRKKDHITFTIKGEAAYRKSTGFERFDFIHNALPEINYEDVTTDVRFLNHHISFPLFISSMTGGYSDAGAVNAVIARFCEKNNLPFGVGSQRIMLEKEEARESFEIVREEAPTAFIASNIGGAQIIGDYNEQAIRTITESIRADAIIVHLNPLQELMQPGGDRNFAGVREGIRLLVENTEVPVIVKETGAGLSTAVVDILADCGVSAIDVAGAGGTSWARVENLRKEGQAQSPFDNWGIPTADCLLELQNVNLGDMYLIASGGIRGTFDIAKSLCLGAEMAATAQPIIKVIMESGEEGLQDLYDTWVEEFKMLLMLLGCDKPTDLTTRHLRTVSN